MITVNFLSENASKLPIQDSDYETLRKKYDNLYNNSSVKKQVNNFLATSAYLRRILDKFEKTGNIPAASTTELKLAYARMLKLEDAFEKEQKDAKIFKSGTWVIHSDPNDTFMYLRERMGRTVSKLNK